MVVLASAKAVERVTLEALRLFHRVFPSAMNILHHIQTIKAKLQRRQTWNTAVPGHHHCSPPSSYPLFDRSDRLVSISHSILEKRS